MNNSKSGYIDFDYQAIFDVGPDATFILSTDGRILNANRIAIQHYGYSLDELKQMNISALSIAHGDDLPSPTPENLMAPGDANEWRFRRKDGTELAVEIYSRLIVLQAEQVILSRVRDISRKTNFESELRDRIHLLERILDTKSGTVYIYDLLRQQNVYVNRRWLNTFGYSAEASRAMGAEIIQIFHPDDLARISASRAAWGKAPEGEMRVLEYRIWNSDGDWRWLTSRETPFCHAPDGTVTDILGITYDITEQRHAEALLSGQTLILEMIAADAPLPEILTSLILLIEDHTPGMLGSILLLDEDDIHVCHGAAPNLPAEFVTAIDKQPIGPRAGSCGTAAYRKEAVFVEDIATDPLWENYKTAALPNGLRACWSTPIFDAQKRVLGTFAMYYRQPGLPTPEHLRLIDATTHLAAIAIGHFKSEQVLRLSEERLRLAHTIANQSWFDMDIRTGLASVGADYPGMLGFDAGDLKLSRENWMAALHPDDRDSVARAFEACLASGGPTSMEYRRRTQSGDWLWMHAIGKIVEWDNEHKPVRMIGILMDISERKLAEAKIQRLTQLYAALSQCNQAIVRCASETELLPQICRDAVKFVGMKMAWIGMLDEATKRVNPVASYGMGTEYLAELEVSIDANSETGKGPTGISIREDRPSWCQNFQCDPSLAAWRERGAKFGWAAMASLPLHRRGAVVGAFLLYSDVADSFDEAAQTLLVEMAMDISFALDRFVSEAERKQEQAQLRKLSQAVEQSPNVIIITDLEGHVEYVNPAFTRTTGYSFAEIVGKNPRLLQSGKTPRETYRAMWRQLSCGKSWQGELVNRRKDGTEYFESVYLSPMLGADGQITHYLGIKEDVTERKLAEQRIQYLAHFDALTGLPNRLQLNERLKYALGLAKRGNSSLAMMFLDLDNFKDINDTLGHSVGDNLLIELSRRIQTMLREEDTVSRLGGDEFILLLPGTDAQGAAQVAQKLLDTIAQSYHIEPHDLTVTTSIGIAVYPDDGADLETLFRNADAAMYRAKQEGRNGYRFFTQEMQAGLARNLQLLNALRRALELGQLEVYYQPQIALQDGRIVGMEALLRWRHPELGSVPPSEFIPIAESSGLILSIGEWVLRTAVQQAQAWRQSGLAPMVVAVNLSVLQFRHSDLPDLVARIISEAGLPPEYLELELTESITMQDPLGAIAVMNNLHERGVRMSIDDFGTGYSSLSYLKKFNVYKLKIDQSFVRDISTDPEDKAIVMAIINMAKNLGLKTIAEGVETAAQLNFLRDQGCDEAQGFFYSLPLPAEEFMQFVNSAATRTR